MGVDVTDGVYFNEFDPFAAQWLRNLYPTATVDEKDIRDIQPADVSGFRRCHFFGGIGGWEYALELAGWGNTEVWTGSCPCQPFSAAGNQKGEADERHLWPELLRLIAERQPATVFGEQVASLLGREWLAGVRDDLEAVGYEVGAADLCAAGVGSPQRRQRLYWAANSKSGGYKQRDVGDETSPQRQALGGWENQRSRRHVATDGSDDIEGVVNAEGGSRKKSERRSTGTPKGERFGRVLEPGGPSLTDASGVGHSASAGPQEQWREYCPSGERCSGLVGFAMQAGVPQWNGPTIAVECSDGPRRVSAQPDSFPLAHGVSKRVGKLRGAGNAIVPQVAATFIRAFMEAT